MSSNMSSSVKTQSPVDPKMLPKLLPTPKYPITAYNRQPKIYTFATSYTKPNYSKPENNTSQPLKGPTKEERDEWRKKGLCMWCGQKFVQGHQCIRSQLYQLLIEDIEPAEVDTEEFFDCIGNGEALI